MIYTGPTVARKIYAVNQIAGVLHIKYIHPYLPYGPPKIKQ